jgi:hypothetical protein
MLVSRNSIELNPLLDIICMSGANVQVIETGTFGAAFIVKERGRQLFIKTHLNVRGNKSLLKEGLILAELYQEKLSARCLETNYAGRRTWLMMNVLQRPRLDFTPKEVINFTNELHSRLRQFSGATIISRDDSVATLIGEAWTALENLSNLELLSIDLQKAIYYHLLCIESEIGALEPSLCHGDLSPNNLMTDGYQSYAIDWEDVFWGVEGYDYLFWLTFFNNRKYYSGGMFGHTPLGSKLEQSILVMILLLKSELAFRDGSYLTNKLDFNQRIGEIVDLRQS